MARQDATPRDTENDSAVYYSSSSQQSAELRCARGRCTRAQSGDRQRALPGLAGRALLWRPPPTEPSADAVLSHGQVLSVAVRLHRDCVHPPHHAARVLRP